MSAEKRTRSHRITTGPRRQTLDVVIAGSNATRREAWELALRAEVGDESEDRFFNVSDSDDAQRILGNLTNPLLLLDAECIETWGTEALSQLFSTLPTVAVVVALDQRTDGKQIERLRELHPLDDWRCGPLERIEAAALLQSARERLFLRNRLHDGEGTTRTEEKLRKLNRVGVVLSKERDLNKLLGLVLHECRSLLDADAGSIYILEAPGGHKSGRNKVLGRVQQRSTASALKVSGNRIEAEGFTLRFAAAQNDSVEIPFQEFSFPLDSKSIAGYTALRGEVVALADVYAIPDGAPYGFNAAMDTKHGYRCVSMLSIPMRNMRDEVIGVIQLINKKRDPSEVLADPRSIPSRVLKFGDEDTELATTLGTFAGTTIENVRLYDRVSQLFEKFVAAVVRAIDQRDPSTAGHSARVDRLTLAIAESISHASDGPYAGVSFSDDEMVELHYAAILHDVGKIGVREHVLSKANKLYPGQEETLALRAKLIRAGLRIRQHEASNTEHEIAADLAALDAGLLLVAKLSKPGFVNDADLAALQTLAERRWNVPDGFPDALLTPHDTKSLAIRRGSLNDEERLEIESHVRKSREFLKQIPWTDELANVPLIAGAHHEKMNGKGYPDGVPAAETPLQARIMAVADVFDSLTSSDRPYKPAIPLERACEILGAMAKDGDLDPQVVEFFIASKLWDRLRLKLLRLADANEAQRAAQ